jgi:RNA polymerase sigma factor (sigma-70 family)
MESLSDLVSQAQKGDLEAYGRLVQATQSMVCAVAFAVLHDSALAQDVAQESYMRAFRRLNDLSEPAAFPSWLRRIVITVAMNMRRSQRSTLLRLDDIPELPVLDEQETVWSDSQRHRLAAALLTLTNEERRLCDRRYYGRWSVGRLAADAGVDEPTLRKRLQRIRDKLRREIEMTEQQNGPEEIGSELPTKVVELLARPRLIDLPENPVGQTIETLRTAFADFMEIDLPEVVDMAEAQKTVGGDALYLDQHELHRVDDNRILRYDLTLPLLLAAASRPTNQPLRLWSAGKVYRVCQTDATHLEAFHQAEVHWVDRSENIDAWRVAGKVLQSVDLLLPGSAVRIVPTQYPMCRQAWELEAERDGHWSEIIAWGVFTDKIVTHLGYDPTGFTAIGVGYGLERLAMLRYGIDDIRKLEVATVG